MVSNIVAKVYTWNKPCLEIHLLYWLLLLLELPTTSVCCSYTVCTTLLLLDVTWWICTSELSMKSKAKSFSILLAFSISKSYIKCRGINKTYNFLYFIAANLNGIYRYHSIEVSFPLICLILFLARKGSQ